MDYSFNSGRSYIFLLNIDRLDQKQNLNRLTRVKNISTARLESTILNSKYMADESVR